MMNKNFFWAKGFTLIEVMVASVLMGLMGVFLMSTINSSIDAKDAVEEISTRYHLVRQAMSRMAREISMAYLSKHINSSEPAFSTMFKGYKNRLYFSALGHVVRQKDAKQSDQHVLAFYLARDRADNQSLMRREQPNLNLDVEKDGISQVLCPKVSKLEFSYYDEKLDKWEETWLADSMQNFAEGQALSQLAIEQKSTDSLLKSGRLPRFVKISMTIGVGEENEMTFITETEIFLQEPLDLN
jgi:general secretion pathway protein J